MQPSTAFDKIWSAHLIKRIGGDRDLIFVDRHVLQETTSAQAFDGLRKAGRGVRHPEMTVATQDHIPSTRPGRNESTNGEGIELLRLMRGNAMQNSIRLFGLGDPRQGIVHVIAPELGIALPGCVLACGDSHTSTVGGIGALGIGIGTSEVEHALATQTLILPRPKTMRINYRGRIGRGTVAKDIILHTIGRLGIAAGRGHAVEYAGEAIRALSVEERLTLCNMSIELGARVGFVAPDSVAIDYVKGREYAPKGAILEAAARYWAGLTSDPGAAFDSAYEIDVTDLAPQVTWGNTQEDVVAVDEPVPEPASFPDAEKRDAARQALAYMDIVPGVPLANVPVDVVFIGSCTNSRISDLRQAAAIVRGRHVAEGVRALVVPGSTTVKREAEALGLDRIFVDAGFEWREAGCSMCVSINEDVVPPGKRCVATSNRNFRGRQGAQSRTHLASPLTAAASALAGRIADVRPLPEA